MKKRKVDPWFPFWIDKWLFGSTRIELEPDERGVFVDLMALSKKDDGYIRANEGVPYLETQLCGLLNITSELLARTIKKCIKYGKAKKCKGGTIYMTSHDVYKLSPRQERRVESEMAEKEDIEAKKPDTKKKKDNKNKNNNKLNKNKIKKTLMSSSFKNNIILKWNTLAGKHNLAAIMEITSGSLREKNLRARSANKNFDFDLLLDMIDNSPFLLGKTKNPFFVFFDWIIKPTNYQKIIEGNYLDRQSYQKFSGIIEGIKDLKKQHEEAKKDES